MLNLDTNIPMDNEKFNTLLVKLLIENFATATSLSEIILEYIADGDEEYYSELAKKFEEKRSQKTLEISATIHTKFG
jgi:hypothetical protein